MKPCFPGSLRLSRSEVASIKTPCIPPLGARLQEAGLLRTARLADARPRLGLRGSGAPPAFPHARALCSGEAESARAAAAGSPAAPALGPALRPAPAQLIGRRCGGAEPGAARELISDAVFWLSLVVPDPERSWGCGPHSGDGGGRRRRRRWGRALCPAAHPVSPLRRERRWRRQTHHRPPPSQGSGEATGGGPPSPPSCLEDSQGVEEERIQSGARSMGTAAAGGGCGARRWLPWLGLCFWAAGAAAARGKLPVDGGVRAEKRTEEERDPHLRRGLPKLCLLLSRVRSATRWKPGGGAPGDHCLAIQVCYLPQSYRLL